MGLGFSVSRMTQPGRWVLGRCRGAAWAVECTWQVLSPSGLEKDARLVL